LPWSEGIVPLRTFSLYAGYGPTRDAQDIPTNGSDAALPKRCAVPGIRGVHELPCQFPQFFHPGYRGASYVTAKEGDTFVQIAVAWSIFLEKTQETHGAVNRKTLQFLATKTGHLNGEREANSGWKDRTPQDVIDGHNGGIRI
jgi:hypothetical protein